MLQVYLVRHGETQWNAERRIQGQSDSPLTAKGEQQAMQVGETRPQPRHHPYHQQRFRPHKTHGGDYRPGVRV
ncbi:phosphoglycerate mutase 2 [Salmonella enterica subsp. enterica]|uniref:Phosphoglycerate mutase 2 n=1 Tax=Salmonella enterica I TaxID=59201 RepID=A0A447TND8_SALET|nr:phosphoglycerate mutase 2 [Salmonella enterica subsp. enterica]